MRLVTLIRKRATRTIVAASLLLSFVGCGAHGFLGLQDYQRDLLFGIGGGLASALLSNALQGGLFPGDGDQTTEPTRGAPGIQGPAGPPGLSFFSVFTDKFFSATTTDGFDIVPAPNDAPLLGGDADPVAYRFAVPSPYRRVVTESGEIADELGDANPVTMRLFFFRAGECSDGCLLLGLDARRLQAGDSAPQCFGGSEADCADGRRWVQVSSVCDDGASVDVYVIIDLPLGPGGLEFPDLFPGDWLAFELSSASDDGGTYRLLGVEFFESNTAELVNAEVFRDRESVPDECGGPPAPTPDCNKNGVPDDLDIANGTSKDCNENDIPDECDIASGFSDDQNENGVPDECEDCNDNGVPDDLDIARGTSKDCNENDIPDECDIASGFSDDDNENGVPDECEPCEFDETPPVITCPPDVTVFCQEPTDPNATGRATAVDNCDEDVEITWQDTVTDPNDYEDLIDDLGPIHWWRLGETPGATVAVDIKGGLNGTYSSGMTLGLPGAVAGDPDTAAKFLFSHVEVPSAADLESLSSGTIAFCMFDTGSIDDVGLFSKDASGFGAGGHLTIATTTDEVIEVRLQSTNGDNYVMSGPITLDHWYDVVFTFGPDGMKLYVGGVLVDSDSYAGGLVGNTEPFVFGASTVNSNAGSVEPLTGLFSGLMDEVMILDYPLSPQQIVKLHDIKLFGPPPCPAQITRTWTATDNSENSSSCDQIITISEGEAQ